MKQHTFYLIALSLFFFSCHTLIAQAPKSSPHTWGEVSKEDLDMSQYEKDPEAAALILLDYGHWELKKASKGMGYKALLTYHIRIKILKEEGLEWADVTLPYIKAEKMERLSGFHAQTINAGENGPEIIKLEKDQIFDTKVNESLSELRFTFQKAKVGSILEYTYQKATLNIFSLEPWYFQNSIPVKHSELVLDCAKYIDYYLLGESVEKNKKGNYHWVMKDIPKLKEESYVANMDHYRTSVKFELKDYQRTYSAYGSRYTVKSTLFKSWTQLSREYYSKNQSIGFFQGNRFKALADSITGETSDSLEMVKRIYSFVRDSMEWNGYYSYLVRRDANKLLTVKKGNSAEINAFLTDLLNHAGIPSDVVLISTRDSEPYTFDTPRLTQFNHLICAAQIGGQIYFLDAIDKQRPYNLLDENDLNQYGRLVNPRGHGWLEIPNTYESNSRTTSLIHIDSLGKMSADITESFKGYAALDLRKAINLLEESDEEYSIQDIYKERLEESGSDVELDSVKIKQLDEPDKPLSLSYSFTSKDFIQVSGDFMYISPFLVYGFSKNPFLDEERVHPIDFNYLISDTYISTFQIPEGYTIESIPKSVKIKLPNDEANLHFLCQNMGPYIQIHSEFHIRQALFDPSAYPYLKEIFDNMIAKHTEQIVLKRVTE